MKSDRRLIQERRVDLQSAILWAGWPATAGHPACICGWRSQFPRGPETRVEPSPVRSRPEPHEGVARLSLAHHTDGFDIGPIHGDACCEADHRSHTPLEASTMLVKIRIAADPNWLQPTPGRATRSRSVPKPSGTKMRQRRFATGFSNQRPGEDFEYSCPGLDALETLTPASQDPDVDRRPATAQRYR